MGFEAIAGIAMNALGGGGGGGFDLSSLFGGGGSNPLSGLLGGLFN